MEKKLAQLQAHRAEGPRGRLGLRLRRLGRPPRCNTANVFIDLKPLGERGASADQIVQRLRPKLNAISGARLFLQAQQDLQIGGRQTAAEYQYTLSGDDAGAIYSLVAEADRRARQVSRIN